MIAFTTAILAVASPAGPIGPDGVGPVRIGMAARKVKRVATVLKDLQSVNEETGERERLIRARWSGALTDIDIDVETGRVVAVTVERPGLRTRHAIAVGDGIASVARLGAAEILHWGGSTFVRSIGGCSPLYRVDEYLGPGEVATDWTRVEPRWLPGSVAIVAIVANGCDAPRR